MEPKKWQDFVQCSTTNTGPNIFGYCESRLVLTVVKHAGK